MRTVFSKAPLRYLRDGILKLGYRLDPRQTALSVETDWLKELLVLEMPNWSWHRLDRVFSEIRRSLRAQTLDGAPNWRYSPDYTHHVARHTFQSVTPHADIVGKFYLDVGCGVQHPFGTSCVMYLNGARETLAMDREALDERRVAEALFDLLVDCTLFPDRWHWAAIPRDDFLRRLGSFNAKALQNGDLAAGLNGLPLRYLKADVCAGLPVAPGSVDVMASRDALEHFLDFPSALAAMTAALKVGGVACHHIDLVDHRAYRWTDPDDFTAEYLRDAVRMVPELHEWSFLSEGESYRDGLCNRLRAGEFRDLFHSAGYEILQENPVRKPLPAGFRGQLDRKYAALTDEDLSTTRVTFVLRRTK